jgi:hypothetical protein
VAQHAPSVPGSAATAFRQLVLTGPTPTAPRPRCGPGVVRDAAGPSHRPAHGRVAGPARRPRGVQPDLSRHQAASNAHAWRSRSRIHTSAWTSSSADGRPDRGGPTARGRAGRRHGDAARLGWERRPGPPHQLMSPPSSQVERVSITRPGNGPGEEVSQRVVEREPLSSLRGRMTPVPGRHRRRWTAARPAERRAPCPSWPRRSMAASSRTVKLARRGRARRAGRASTAAAPPRVRSPAAPAIAAGRQPAAGPPPTRTAASANARGTAAVMRTPPTPPCRDLDRPRELTTAALLRGRGAARRAPACRRRGCVARLGSARWHGRRRRPQRGRTRVR